MGRNPIYRRKGGNKTQHIHVKKNYNGVITAYENHMGRLNYICDENSEEWTQMQKLIDQKRKKGWVVNVSGAFANFC
jgi:hypothetical protein